MKFTVFREMLDYMAHIGTITDADMNCYVSIPENHTMSITCEKDDTVITMDVCFRKKEVAKDGT